MIIVGGNVSEDAVMKLQRAKMALRDLWNKAQMGQTLQGTAHFSLGDVMEQCPLHLQLIEKLADSVYPKDVAWTITDKVRAINEVLNELKMISKEYYEEDHDLLEEEREAKDGEYIPLSHEADKLRDEYLDNYNKKVYEFKEPFLDLLTELDKWEVVKYPQPSAADIIRKDLDLLAKRLARGEISETTYEDAKKRLEGELKKIERMGTE